MLRFLLIKSQIFFLYRFRKIGKDCRLDKSLFIYPNRVSIGDRCYIGRFSYLDGDIYIGNYTMLASNVAIVGGDHVFSNPDILMIDSGREHWRTTRIGSNCWIGHGAIIINGINIGDNSVVAAGSVVVKDVPSNVIVAGNPARVIKLLA